jgi:WD40 repeat protein
MILEFSPNSQVLASASEDGSIRLQETTGRLLFRFEGHSPAAKVLLLSLSNRHLISAFSDGTISLWDIISGTPRGVLKRYSAPVRNLSLSLDGRLLASSANGYTLDIWDLMSGSMRQSLESRSDLVQRLGFSSEGRFLATESDDNTVRLWDIETRQQIQRLGNGHETPSPSLAADVAFAGGGGERAEFNALALSFIQRASGDPYSLDQTQQWVTWKNKNILWLPVDYRSSCAMYHNILVLGHVSGAVVFLRFESENSPEP